MNLLVNLRIGQRLAAACGLVLSLLAALTAVALGASGRQAAQMAELQGQTLPTVRLVHALSQQVNDLRGLEALHLLLASAAEMNAIEAQVAQQRRAIDTRLATHARQPADEAERQQVAAVQAALATYWQAQDTLFALSRRSPADPALQARARQQLAGPSQQAYQGLNLAIEAWWAQQEQRAAQAAEQSRSGAAAATALLGGLGLLAATGVLLAAWLVRRSIAGPPNQALRPAGSAAAAVDRSFAGPAPGPDAGPRLPKALEPLCRPAGCPPAGAQQGADGRAGATPVQALNAAVQAARAGAQDPGSAALADATRRPAAPQR